MAVTGVSGLAAAAAGAGGLLIWSGIKGANLSRTVRSVISGNQPAGQDPALAVSGSYDTAGAAAAAGSMVTGAPGASSYDQASLQALWQQAGGSAAAARNAACHAMQESGGRPAVTSANPDGGTNVGLWQLDTRGKGAGYTVAQLQNPLINARITVMATRNGADWSAWATPGC